MAAPRIPTPTQPSLSPVVGPIDIPRLSLSWTNNHSDETSLASSFVSDSSSIDSSLSAPSTAGSCADDCCLPLPGKRDKVQPTYIPASKYIPLIVIGAGPHALALAARLSESRPAALYTDLEHARLNWLRRARHERDQKKRATVKGHWAARKLVQPAEANVVEPSAIKVFDSTADRFMGRWDTYFSNLSLDTLRSPMTFHPAPADADALVAFARREQREAELMPIDGVVGAEFSKYQRKKNSKRFGRAHTINERERQDYFRPGTTLFADFLEKDLVSRYDLGSIVTQAEVIDITYGPLHVQDHDVVQGFRVIVRLPSGELETFGSKAVVFAVGPSSKYNIPPAISAALPHNASSIPEPGLPWSRSAIQGEAWCHSAAFAMKDFVFLSERVRAKIAKGRSTTVVVVGGGLTSAQIVDLCVKSGVSRVVLICRSRIKIKHFDFDLEWVSKYANLSKQSFWQEECRHARFDMIKAARNGGSVNPQYYRLLKSHIKTGAVELRESTQVQRADYDIESSQWTLELDKDETLENVDYIVCSTGSKLDFSDLPCAQSLLKQHPVDVINGLPVLTTDLQWNSGLPAFVMGAYAMLELGPDALNLSGTRHGAERIAHRLGQLGILTEDDELAEEELRFGSGESPFFSSLGEMEL